MVPALDDLVKEGFFGSESEQSKPTLLCRDLRLGTRVLVRAAIRPSIEFRCLSARPFARKSLKTPRKNYVQQMQEAEDFEKTEWKHGGLTRSFLRYLSAGAQLTLDRGRHAKHRPGSLPSRIRTTPRAASSSRRAGGGFGLLGPRRFAATRSLLAQEPAWRAPDPARPLAPRTGHHPAKAKNIIWLFINGGPSHVDTWDFKPELIRRNGQELAGFDQNTGFFREQVGPIMRSPFRFRQHGQCGKWISDIFPNLARHVDKMAFIHSCWTDSNNHSPALMKINTGFTRMGFPCAGSWVTYGLGSESQNLPAFVVMYDTLGRGLAQGLFAKLGRRLLAEHLSRHRPQSRKGRRSTTCCGPTICTDQQQRNQLDLMARLNRRQLASPNRAQGDGWESGRAGRPHRDLRARLSHADGRPRSDRHRPRNASRRIGSTASTIRAASTSPSNA